jgi:hypothetical protein
VEESNTRQAGLRRIGRNGANAIDAGAERLTVIVHDDRNIMAQITPRSSEQHVLNRLAAEEDVGGVPRQHGVVLEPNDADLFCRHDCPHEPMLCVDAARCIPL